MFWTNLRNFISLPKTNIDDKRENAVIEKKFTSHSGKWRDAAGNG